MQYYKVVKILPKEIKAMKSKFELLGSKAEFYREYKITRATIDRVLRNEKGLDRVVDAMKKYCGLQ